MRPSTTLVPEESVAYYDDVRDHLIRVVDMIDTMRDYLMDSLDIYTTRQTQRNAEETRRVNQSVARLTAVSTLFLPLTFITSVYGMNFVNIPELTRDMATSSSSPFSSRSRRRCSSTCAARG